MDTVCVRACPCLYTVKIRIQFVGTYIDTIDTYHRYAYISKSDTYRFQDRIQGHRVCTVSDTCHSMQLLSTTSFSKNSQIKSKTLQTMSAQLKSLKQHTTTYPSSDTNHQTPIITAHPSSQIYARLSPAPKPTRTSEMHRFVQKSIMRKKKVNNESVDIKISSVHVHAIALHFM